MLPQQLLVLLTLASGITAVPLNINLGAYSPALVVGDGEISVGGGERVGQVLETLATGAASAGAANGQQQGSAAEAAAVPVQASTAAPGGAATTEGESTTPARAIRKGLDPAAGTAMPNLAKRAESSVAQVEEAASILKREIEGFREALKFATEAMKNQPKVELGTGEGGSGVGVIVNPGLNVPANSAAAGVAAAAAKVKRDEYDFKREETETTEKGKKGITLMAITEI